MRPIEIVATVAGLTALAVVVAPSVSVFGAGAALPAGLLAGVAIAAGGVGLAMNHHRWQTIPVCLTAVGVLAMIALSFEPDGALRYAVASLGLAACALTVLLGTGMPMRELPAPDGPFAVGATRVELMRITGDGEPRRIIVKVSYPAEPSAVTGAAREPLWSEFHGAAGVPLPMRLLTGYLRGVETHTHVGARIRHDVDERPLVIYNHALVSTPSENTLLVESLASHGYVVAAISHLDQLAEHRRTQAAVSAEERTRDRERFGRLREAADRTERARIMAEAYRDSTGVAALVRSRAADAAFVLDEIEIVLGAIPGFGDSRPIDRERVGALGFSVGGAVATRSCLTDARYRAVVNIDGGLFGIELDEPLPVPYLMIYPEANAGANDVLQASAKAGFDEVVVSGTKHLDLSDATVIWPLLKWIGVLGRAPGTNVAALVRARVRKFLETHMPARERRDIADAGQV